LICGEYVQDQTGFSSDEMELQSFLVFLILHYQKHPGIGAVLAAIGLILVFIQIKLSTKADSTLQQCPQS
jgi:hypothetical protein